MRLTRLNLFAVLFVLGGVFSASTASVIRWASVSHESARLAAIVAMPIPATIPAAIALTPTTDLFPPEAPATHTSAQPIATHTPLSVPPTAMATHIPPTATQAPKPARTPPRAVYYTVKPGDNLTHIAARFGTTVDAIVRTNKLPSSVIYAGQVLSIPAR